MLRAMFREACLPFMPLETPWHRSNFRIWRERSLLGSKGVGLVIATLNLLLASPPEDDGYGYVL